MKNKLVLSSVLLILASLFSGCSSLLGGEEGPRPQPLDAAQWPTAQPPVTTPTPTPFSAATLVATPTRVAVELSTPTPEPAAAGLDDAPVAEVLTSVLAQMDSSGSEFASAIRSLSGVPALPPGLAPVAIGLVMADQVGIRQGPGESYAARSTVSRGDLAGVLGRNEDRSWVYVITLQKVLGWLPTDSLRITGGNLEAEPVLPPDPLAALLSQASAAGAGQTGTETTSSVDLATLKPVAAAKVTSEQLNLRQNPGTNGQILSTLNRDDEISILALNQAQDWALVETTNDQQGWVALYLIEVDGDLANAPNVPAARTASPNSAASTAELSTVGAAAPMGDQPNVLITDVSTSGSGTALPGQIFTRVDSAKIAEKVDSRRGPDTSFGAVDTLTVDEPVDILARNETGDWVVVRATSGSVGWVPASAVKEVEGQVENASPVMTGWIKSNETDLYSGPGIYYDKVGKLAINDVVAILGLDSGRSWVAVEALNGGRGWVPLRLIEVSGSLADVPEFQPPPVVETSTAAADLPQPGPESATTGQIVFQTASGGDIMIINADGTGLRKLTNGIDPVLSPDGKQVAFTRWIGDIGELWVINADGSGERQILGSMRKAKGPDWSPDSSKIVLNFQAGGRTNEKRVCRPLSSNPTPPRNAFDFGVKVNGEGKLELCWTLPVDPNWTLRVIDVADSSFEDLYGGLYAFRPAWNPEQAWQIVSDAGNGLLAVDVSDNDNRRQLTDVVGDSSPVFSPDGRFIALATRLQNEYGIFRMNSDGGNRVRLTSTPLWEPVQPENNGRLWNFVAPTWSPDGSLIAFLTDREGRWEIWVMNADGSNQRPLFPDEVDDQININYEFVDERVLSWR